MGPLEKQVVEFGSKLWRGIPAAWRHSVLRRLQDSFMVGVVGLIQSDDGRVLLFEHRFRVPSPWGLPGGFIERGETFAAALEREVFEESGLRVRSSGEILDVEYNVEHAWVCMTLRAELATPFDTQTIRLSREILSVALVEKSELPDAIYARHRAAIARHA